VACGAPVSPALSVVVVSATVVGLALPSRTPPSRSAGGLWSHPGTWLSIVTALLLLNQVLFTIYVEREWNGDASRIAHHLPDGWFALADLDILADRFPAPHLLGWTVLRAQAGLELPFVLLAYLTVCRWFGREAFRRAVGARWAASAAWTVSFCLIEWRFCNPYTVDDLLVRAAAAVLVPPLLGSLAEGPPGPTRVTAWIVSTGALGCLVLAVYDAALLYNLGHLAHWLPMVVAAGVTIAVARRWARTPVYRGPTAAAATRCLGWFLTAFLVPSLPVRYGLAFGAATVSVLAGGLVVAVALWRGSDRRVARGLTLAVGAAALAGGLGLAVVPDRLAEGRLLAAGVAAVLAGGATCLVIDLELGRRR
jgi:hypothetical protein